MDDEQNITVGNTGSVGGTATVTPAKPKSKKPDLTPVPEPPPDEEVVAVEEVKEEPEPKVAKIGEVELKLPDALPPAIIFDLVELEASDNDPMPVMRTLRSMLGSEQFTALRHHVEASGIEDLTELLDMIFGQYGVKLGE